MHRSYQPITPASNKLLKRRWDDTYFEEHRRKVATSKAVVDNKPPRTYMHLHLKLKKLQLEEERLATIERDNRILLEKMSQIMRTKGRVDNWNDYSAKSLNRTKRQQELLRVTHENQAILKRVLEQKPVYDHSKWEDDWLEKEGYMDSISKYPKEWYKKCAAKKNSPSEKTREKRSDGKSQDGSTSKKSSKKEKLSPREEKDGRSPSPREGKQDDGGSKRSSKKDSMSPKIEKGERSPSPTEGKETIIEVDKTVQEEEIVEENEIRNDEIDEKPVKQDEKPEKKDEKPGKQDGELVKQDEIPDDKAGTEDKDLETKDITEDNKGDKIENEVS